MTIFFIQWKPENGEILVVFLKLLSIKCHIKFVICSSIISEKCLNTETFVRILLILNMWSRYLMREFLDRRINAWTEFKLSLQGMTLTG